MLGSQCEVQNVEEEGVEFVWLFVFGVFVGYVIGEVKVVQEIDVVEIVIVLVCIQKMWLGVLDVFGCCLFELIEGVDYDELVELVIKVFGFEFEELFCLWGVEGLEMMCWGMICVDYQMYQISLFGVFVVGDIVCGVLLVVWVICDGCEVVDSIMGYLFGVVCVVVE